MLQLSVFEDRFEGHKRVIRPIEIWRKGDGSFLLHHPTHGQDHNWIEIAPEAIPWVVQELSKGLEI